jgi:hypothetical protein
MADQAGGGYGARTNLGLGGHMKKLACIAALAATVAACGSGFVRESVNAPAIGSLATRTVGEELIRRDTGVLVPEMVVQSDIVIGGHPLSEGRYTWYGENRKGVWFSGNGQDFHMRRADGHLCVDAVDACAQADYVLEKRLSNLSPESFQQTLLYNGRIGNRVTLAYREFTNDMARPAYSNEVDYDLSESMIVGYRGAKLEIIEATNTEITYRVISGF